MADRRVIVVVLSFIAALLLACVGLWVWFGWLCGLIPVLLLVVMEYALRCKRHGWMRVNRWLWLRIAKRLKRLKRLKRTDVVEAAAIVGKPIVTSIADLLLKDFIACCVYGNLRVLGDGSEGELKVAFTRLLSQYYEVKNDERVRYEVKLRKHIAQLELRRYKVDVLGAILKKRYSVAAADGCDSCTRSMC